jgi:hypothetical protein
MQWHFHFGERGLRLSKNQKLSKKKMDCIDDSELNFNLLGTKVNPYFIDRFQTETNPAKFISILT